MGHTFMTKVEYLRDVLNPAKNCMNQEELQLIKTHMMIERRPLILTHHPYYVRS